MGALLFLGVYWTIKKAGKSGIFMYFLYGI